MRRGFLCLRSLVYVLFVLLCDNVNDNIRYMFAVSLAALGFVGIIRNQYQSNIENSIQRA